MSEIIEFGGERHELKITFAALKEIAKVQPAPGVLYALFESHHYSLSELEATIDAALRAGGSKALASDVIEELGVEPSRLICVALLKELFKREDKEKKPKAART